MDAARDAEVDQPRLFESGDDLEVDVRFLPDAFDEDVAVFRVARGGRGDRVDFLRAEVPGHVREAAQDEDRPLHRLLAQPLLDELALAEPDHDLVLVQDGVRPVRVDPHDEEPHGVGPEIDEADDVPLRGDQMGRHSMTSSRPKVFRKSPPFSIARPMSLSGSRSAPTRIVTSSPARTSMSRTASECE